MTRQRADTRPGARWQPVAPRTTMTPRAKAAPRVAGRHRLRTPALHVPRLHVRRRYALPVLILTFALIGGWWLYRSPPLSIRSVSVQGNVVLSAGSLRQTAGLDGESVIRPDFAEAEQRLAALPLVREAHVSRAWPFGAKITIVERAPWGTWQAGDQGSVIDNQGVVLDLPAPPGSPVITQTDPGAALVQGQRVDAGAIDVAQKLATTAQQTLGRSVTSFEFSRAAGLTAVFDGNLRVIFGDSQSYDFKLATLFALLQKAQNEGNELHSVDLRFGNLVSTQ
jgi:cell division septal protein FtsQ